MSGYQEICLLLVLVCLSPAIVQRNLAENVDEPKYKLTFVVSYNSSGEEMVSTDCGKYYAQTFLENYIMSERLIRRSCNVLYSDLVVDLYTKAKVRLFGARIELDTYMNISLTDGGFDSEKMQNILDCAEIINQTLQDPAAMQEAYKEFDNKALRILDVPGKPSEFCADIYMSPQEFVFQEDQSEWICHHVHMYFSLTQLKCVPYESSTTSTTMSTTENGATSPTVPSSSTEPGPWQITLLNATSTVTLEEGNEPVKLGVKVTVDRARVCEGSDLCKVIVSVDIKAEEGENLRCRSTGEVIPQVLLVKPSWLVAGEICAFSIDLNVTSEVTQYLELAPMLDGKYDGTQYRTLSMSVKSVVNGEESPQQKDVLAVPITILDEDRKATCKSINDPHIATFDGNEYNNFFEGEFVLYRHSHLPYKVHVIYQKCGPGVPASCNCAVAVQSGDDVIVIDRCFRDKKPFNRISGTYNPYITKMSVDLYLNGDLTPGTTVFKQSDGKKYFIYLPHGGYVKVMVSGSLLNVWVVASPKDLQKTSGLCGTYDNNPSNDFTSPDGQVRTYNTMFNGYRQQPREFCLQWRVELYGPESIFRGGTAVDALAKLPVFCDCTKDFPLCGYAVDVSQCDVIQGNDVTKFLIEHAKSPVVRSERRRRSIQDNTISVLPPDEPITIDTSFEPPNYTWEKTDWTQNTAQQFCSDYVKNKYTIGHLCAQIPAVDFNQEINTCIEDILITGNTSWADSARDAMKEQCLEEVQRNSSLPSDIADSIQNSICIHDCSNHGTCKQGSCVCDPNWSTADCSVRSADPPYTSELPETGLCDTRYMNCRRVIVYGEHFINSQNLTCHLQEATVTDKHKDFSAKPKITKQKGLFINFNAVECPVPDLNPYLVRVSNDGKIDHSSDSLLFIPFDSACTSCSTNTTTCTEKKNSCIIDGKCFEENEVSPTDGCLVCKPHADNLEWTTDAADHCRPSWWHKMSLPSWVIALIAAIAGSVVGVLCGFLLYKCCCKRKSQKKGSSNQSSHTNPPSHHHHNHHLHHSSSSSSPRPPPPPSEEGEDSSEMDTDIHTEDRTELSPPFEDVILHRNRGLPTFTDSRFLDIPFQQPTYDHSYNFQHSGGRGVENGVDSSTYF